MVLFKDCGGIVLGWADGVIGLLFEIYTSFVAKFEYCTTLVLEI